MSNALIEKLKQQEAEIKAKIKEAQKAQAKKDAEIYTKKCTVVGAAVLAEMENNPALKASLDPIIDKQTLASKDRRLLGLEPLPKPANEDNKTKVKD